MRAGRPPSPVPPRSARRGFAASLVVALAACGGAGVSSAPGSPSEPPAASRAEPALTPIPTMASAEEPAIAGAPTSSSTTTSASTTTTTTSTTSSTTTTTTSSTSSTTIAPAVVPGDDTGRSIDAAMTRTNAAFDALARNNAAASLTVRRDGATIVARASGTLIDGTPATSDSPMVVASVSKVITALTIAKLEQRGDIAMDQAMPWDFVGIPTHATWADVTIRELLDHTSGMPVARSTWFEGDGDCRSHLPSLVAAPPERNRGTWRYSNGNYCALGLLVEALTASPIDVAAQQLVFEPLAVDGVHLTTNGLLPIDVGHAGRVERLTRLGGAGVFVVSTDDLATMLSAVTWPDYTTLRAPGLFTDQYGWGHTGTADGALSCVWLLDDGRTAVAATIAGNSPSTGGGVCDRIVPAVADDLGIGRGMPDRRP